MLRRFGSFFVFLPLILFSASGYNAQATSTETTRRVISEISETTSPTTLLATKTVASLTSSPVMLKRPDFSREGYRDERLAMVERQIAARGVTDEATLKALRRVPRHRFVPDELLSAAYSDQPLPIGMGQTISQPFVVGYMTEKLDLKPTDRVLEIGTGSGYQAAILAEIVNEVYTVEIVPALGNRARDRIKQLGYSNIETKVADGYFGWKERAPYDAIVVTAAASHVPPPLIEQLKPGGRLVIPVGSTEWTQDLVILTKAPDGSVSTRTLLPVRFVPLMRSAPEKE